MTLWSRLLIVPPVLLGLGFVYWALSNPSEPELVAPAERAVPVAYIEATAQGYVPRVSGFGTVRPTQVWDAVAQVRGRIVALHPNFVRGGVIRAGEVVVEIAAEDYRLAVAQAEANILSAEAQIEELEASADATRASLEIEMRALTLAERELDRQRQLAARGQVSEAAVEAQERSVLGQEAAVQSLENQLQLVPAQRSALEQSLAVSEVALEQAELDLERTALRAPFDGRVAAADVSAGEFVSAGSRLGSLDGVAQVEVTAQMAPLQMAHFARLVGLDGAAEGGSLSALTARGLSAELRVGHEDLGAVWPAEVARISDGVDLATRAIGVIVTVDGPYARARAGTHPPLIKDMFVEVDLIGPVIEDMILVPRAVIDDRSRLMAVGPDSRLEFLEVPVLYTDGDLAVISAEALAPGTQVLISAPSPALPGLLLAPEPDTVTEARLSAAADAPMADGTDQ